MLTALAATLLFGFLEKAEPTFSGGRCLGGLVRGSQAAALCYSDIFVLYGTEHLQNNRLPYLQPCPPHRETQCDEYPPLTMYAMWLAALPAFGYRTFFYANALLLSICAAATAVSLSFMAGRRALYFALAPTLLLYGFFNWDLLAVAFASAATLAFLSRRDGLSGVLIGLGIATKLYPGLLVIPFAIQRMRERNPEGAARVTSAAAVSWLAVNLPFMIVTPRSWSTFFRFNGTRPLNVDSLWYVGCRLLRPSSGGQCVSPRLVNLFALVLVVSIGAMLWMVKTRRHPDWARWTFAFPLIALFLLTSKVYSPQYSLWLLPWIALTLPGIGRLSSLSLFLMFEATEAGVFVTELLWFGTQPGSAGPPQWALMLAVAARDLMLTLCVAAWYAGSGPHHGNLYSGSRAGLEISTS